MNKSLLKLLNFSIFAFVLLSNIVIFAANPGDGDDEGIQPDAPSAPINSKLILLFIAGVSFAIYTFKRNRKEALK